MNEAREAVLRAIRAGLSDVSTTEPPEDVTVDRSYRTVDTSPRETLIEQFVERVAEYKATVRRVSRNDLPGAIAAACQARGVSRLVVPEDLPEGWAPEGLTLLKEPGLSIEQLDQADGVLTACALGIAQTGTIALDRGAGQGRRAITLLPDYHLCVVFEEQVVGLVPEAVSRLRDSSATSGRPITLISGPSATSDIELNRVEGVHGPRILEVLVVGSI
ncbi:MAG: lactate utilization protein C [Isosphaeraceae bacterium]